MKSFRPSVVSFAFLAITLAALPLRAQVVVNGGAPNGAVGMDIFNDYRSSTAFSVGVGGLSFDAIRFWGILPNSLPTYSPRIFWQILADASGAPDNGSVAREGNAFAAGSNPVALAGFTGFTEWQFDFSTGTQTLAPGAFWLALHDGPVDPGAPDPTVNYTNSDLIWGTTGAGSPYDAESISAGLGWARQGDTGLAFELRASEVTSTPEPTSAALVLTGLAGLAGVAFRRRKDP